MSFSSDLTGMDLFGDFDIGDVAVTGGDATSTTTNERASPSKQARVSSSHRRTTRSQVRTRRARAADLISFDDDDNDNTNVARASDRTTASSNNNTDVFDDTSSSASKDMGAQSAVLYDNDVVQQSSQTIAPNVEREVQPSLMNDDDDDDDDFPALATAVKAGAALPNDDVRVQAAVVGNRGPLADSLRVDGLVRLVDNDDATALALRRRDLERVRDERLALLSDVHRSGGLALIDWSASIEDAMVAANDRRLAELVAEHPVELSLPPEIASARDAKYRTVALRVVDDERRRERERATNAVIDAERRSVRDALQAVLQARGDENEEEVSLNDARVVERMRAFRPTANEIDEEMERSGVARALDAARAELASLSFGALVPVTLDELHYYFDEALDRALRDTSRSLTVEAFRASSDWAMRELVAQPVAAMIEAQRTIVNAEAQVERAWIDEWRARYDAPAPAEQVLPRAQMAPIDRLDRIERSVVKLVSGIEPPAARRTGVPRPAPSATSRRAQQSTMTLDEFRGRVRGAIRRFVDERSRPRASHNSEQWRAAIGVGANEFTDEARRARRFAEALRVRMYAAGLVGALERELASIDRELDSVARVRAVARVERRALGAVSAPVDFVATVALRDDGIDASILDGYRFRFTWQVRRDGAPTYETVRVRDASTIPADRLRVSGPFSALDAGRYRVVVTAVPPDTALAVADTTIVSAEATVRVMARCARDCVWYDAARPPPFGACQWSTRPLDASRKRVRDALADEAAIAFGVRVLDSSTDDSAVLAIAVEGPARVRANLFSYEAALHRVTDSFVRVARRYSPTFAATFAPTPLAAAELVLGVRVLVAPLETRQRIVDELTVATNELLASASANANAYERRQVERIRSAVADGRRIASSSSSSSASSASASPTRMRAATSLETLPAAPVVRALRDEQLIVIELDRDRRFVRALADRLDTLELLYVERNARVDHARLDREAPAIDADATLDAERARARRRFAALTAASLRSLPTDLWQIMARAAPAPPRGHSTMLAASSAPSSTIGTTRDDFFVDTDSEREFWRRRDEASSRARSMSDVCDTLAPLDAALSASASALSLHTVADMIEWRGVHSTTSTQPDPYHVEFGVITDAASGEQRSVCAIERGSARVGAGYDFDALHAAIEQACREYTEIRDSDLGAAMMRARRRARVERLVRAYNVVAQYAPTQPPSAPLIGAVEIERFFVERERDALGRPIDASDISGATTNLGGIALVSASSQ